jgi:hypothetical protein
MDSFVTLRFTQLQKSLNVKLLQNDISDLFRQTMELNQYIISHYEKSIDRNVFSYLIHSMAQNSSLQKHLLPLFL